MAPPDGIHPSTMQVPGHQTNPAQPGVAMPSWLPLLLGFLSAVGPVSTDIYLPAFPALEKSLHSAAGSAGMTLSAWMIGLAIGQISMGPLADRFGRRTPMLIGMIAYTLGSVGCAMATTMSAMCFFRLVAAIAASASIVIPSACVRDLSTGNDAARLMSRLILIQGFVPILAPMLGGIALDYISWRAIFWLSAAHGGLCVLLLLRVFPETLPRENRRELRPLSLLQRYLFIGHDRHFMTNAMIWGFCGFLSFTYLTAAPTVFEYIFGFTPAHYGMLFGLFAVCMIGSSQINGALVGRINSSIMLGWAMVVSIAGAIALLVVVMLAEQYPGPTQHIRPIMLIPIVGCMMITLGMTGVIGPNAMVGALSNQSQYAGSASAFAGTMQYALGSIASTAIGVLPANTPMPMAALMLFATLMMGVFAVLRPAPQGTPSA